MKSGASRLDVIFSEMGEIFQNPFLQNLLPTNKKNY